MAPDPLQEAWQTQHSQTRMSVDTDRMFDAVQTSQASFRATIAGRDVTEVGTAIVMIPVWLIMGVVLSLPWTWYLGVPAFLFVAGFILVDRRRHPQRAPRPEEPLIDSARESLRQVEHQIWLLRNVFWWYLLPFSLAILAFFTQTFLSMLRTGPDRDWVETLFVVGSYLFNVSLVAGIYGFIYALNQRAVRQRLEPHRDELKRLLAGLNEDATSELDGPFPILLGASQPQCSPRRRIIAGLCAAVLFAIGIGGIFGILWIGGRIEEHFDPKRFPDDLKKSPFAAVRWERSQPEVKLGDEWFTLVSLDGIPAIEIVDYSRKTYRDVWRKRFEEDLVEVLTRMGRAPGETVQLVVRPVGSQETRTLDDVPMTSANRTAIRDAAQARERAEQNLSTRSSPHHQDAEDPLTKLVVKIRTAEDLVGLGAMVTIDGQVVASAVDGERKIGSGVWLDRNDRWHLGGISKSITATMIARLIESGRLKWSETLGDHFSGAAIHEDWKPVTLEQLLTDTAGVRRSFPVLLRLKRPAPGAESTAARRQAVIDAMADKPIHPPGQRFSYSNVGYAIAAAIAEEATGRHWEDLVNREVFEPLKLANAGFGPPASSDRLLEQPRGHIIQSEGKLATNDDVDNTFIMAPAGSVHMSLTDLCTFATEHIRGEAGRGQLLSKETYQQLHTPALDRYACGWLTRRPDAEIPYSVYWHNGSNTMWYALVACIPDINMVIAVTSNDGDSDSAEAAAWAIVKASVQRFGADGKSR